MASNYIVLFTLNAIFFSIIFWFITFLLKIYYSNKYYKYKYNYYECGFKSLTNLNVKYSINFILLVLFLIIYDGEFLLLIPYSLNVSFTSEFSFYLVIFFFYWLLLTLFIDNMYNTLEWQV